GVATSFCGRHERDQLRQIERLMRKTLAVQDDHPQFLRTQKTHEKHEEPSSPTGPKPRRHGRKWSAPRGKTSKPRRQQQGGASAANAAQNGNGKRRRRPKRIRRTAAV